MADADQPPDQLISCLGCGKLIPPSAPLCAECNQKLFVAAVARVVGKARCESDGELVGLN